MQGLLTSTAAGVDPYQPIRSKTTMLKLIDKYLFYFQVLSILLVDFSSSSSSSITPSPSPYQVSKQIDKMSK